MISNRAVNHITTATSIFEDIVDYIYELISPKPSIEQLNVWLEHKTIMRFKTLCTSTKKKDSVYGCITSINLDENNKIWITINKPYSSIINGTIALDSIIGFTRPDDEEFVYLIIGNDSCKTNREAINKCGSFFSNHGKEKAIDLTGILSWAELKLILRAIYWKNALDKYNFNWQIDDIQSLSLLLIAATKIYDYKLIDYTKDRIFQSLANDCNNSRFPQNTILYLRNHDDPIIKKFVNDLHGEVVHWSRRDIYSQLKFVNFTEIDCKNYLRISGLFLSNVVVMRMLNICEYNFDKIYLDLEWSEFDTLHNIMFCIGNNKIKSIVAKGNDHDHASLFYKYDYRDDDDYFVIDRNDVNFILDFIKKNRSLVELKILSSACKIKRSDFKEINEHLQQNTNYNHYRKNAELFFFSSRNIKKSPAFALPIDCIRQINNFAMKTF